MKINKYDLTQGGIINKLLLVAMPVMGSSLMQMLYNLTDMFWLGRVGSGAVAASGTVGMYMWLAMGFVLMGRMGAEIGVSQNIGRGERETAKAFANNALLLATVLGLAYGVCMVIFAEPMVGFFAIPDAQVVSDAESYLRIIGLGIPFVFISSSINGMFNGSGNSRMPFYINSIGLVINMILDPILIFNANLGIAGAAIATIAAQIVVCLLFMICAVKSPQRPFTRYRLFTKPDRKILASIVKWGTPISMESILFTFLSMLVSRMVAPYGADAIAVQRVGSQIESLSWLIGGGYSTALIAFIGQNYGARQWNRIRQGFKSSLIAMSVWGIIVTALLLFAGGFLFSIFLSEQGLLSQGILYLQILSACQLAMCLESVFAGCFKGFGKTMPPAIVSITGNAVRVPLAYALSLTPLGLYGIWWGVTIGAILRCVCLIIWYIVKSPVRSAVIIYDDVTQNPHT